MAATASTDATTTTTTAAAAKPTVELPPLKLFINNEFVDAKSGKTFETVNPATGELLCKIASAQAEDVDAAVAAARAALSGKWHTMGATERGRLLFRLAELVEGDARRLGRLESVDNGKPVLNATGYDVPQAAKILRYFAGWADKIHGKTIPVEGQLLCYTSHEPVGVVGAIVPWNFPLMLACWKLGPSLAAGCTVVLKPAEQTSLSVLRLAELAVQAGFPPGVLNVVPGLGPEAGQAITSHAGIDKVSFTGGTETGRRVMEAAAKSNIKRVALELGGKSPNIVFDDCDFAEAVAGAQQAIFVNMGENCCAGSRLFVHEAIYDRFVAELAAKAGALVVGNPLDAKTEQGALVDQRQFNKVLDYIAIGKQQGARVVCGGERHGSTGFFVKPTIFADVTDDMRIAREEIFGPVLAVLKFSSTDEVIRRANALPFGLAAGVWTRDIAKAHTVAAGLQAGTVWLNTYNVVQATAPFGGCKESGFGRELSKYALHDYLTIKTVYVNTASKL